MHNVTKIDIIKQEIFCYDEEKNEKEIYPLTSEYDFFINEFSNTQELLTVNIYKPMPRLIRFYNITESVPESFVILEYADMTANQKVIFDEFVEMIKAK